MTDVRRHDDLRLTAEETRDVMDEFNRLIAQLEAGDDQQNEDD